HVLADYQNLTRKTQSDIEKGVNTKIDEFMLDFLKIYDDFIRAKQVFAESNINTEGLDSILKNMDSLLSKYNVTPIDALGEIFDPNFHEAISIIADSNLDDNTITKELRKGYISHKRVIRPTLVEISKK
ncbi:MAG TPA: nucleotide exchange factor GrpE, partial [Nitrosarchaeum sp.]|nr:nucleotide exchange factor GrpE [Nitrosarchaeum sp.]